jgi:transcriptional regulator with XRE-family HTH domain
MKNKFANRLKSLIEEKNITRTILAEELEMSYQQISNYINSESYPTIERLIILSNYFDVSTDYLLGLSNIKKENENFIVELRKNNKGLYRFIKKVTSKKY